MSKCGRCIHAAAGDKTCPWHDRFQPVDGWTATPTVISEKQSYREDSYEVADCPLYERGHPERHYSDDAISRIAIETMFQAVDDWRSLDSGKRDELRYVGQTIKREELIEFFNSPWFETMVRSVLDVSPSKIRKALRVPKMEAVL